MRKAYLLVYSEATGSREKLKEWANSEPMVVTWRYDLPNCFYIISEASAQELSNSLRNFTNDNGRFIFSEIHQNRYGWLPSSSWYLLTNKTHKPKDR